VAVLRIAIAVSLLWALYRIGERAERSRSARYYAHGIWMLYPGRPGPELISALTVVAWVSTAMMLVGLRTRLAHAVSLFATLAVATFEISGLPTWTHQNVPPILASMALLGARTGDALAIDAWLHRQRGRELPPATGAQGSARLVQLVVASVFFVAGVCKLEQGGPSLGWVLSDNLRHQLLMRFDWIHVERTPIADWMLGAAWRYQLFAGLNLISQLSPIMAVFLVRRPLLRAALGAVWILEVVGLGVVMALWDTHWLPLAAAFIDWDALAAWLRRSRPIEPPVAPRPSTRRRWQIGYVSALLLFYAVQAFGLNQRLNLYPFSSYPMFSAVRAKRPFDVHQSYELMGGRVEVGAAPPLTGAQQRWIDGRINFRWMWQERRPAEVLLAIDDEVPEARPIAARSTATGFELAAPIVSDAVYVVARPSSSTLRWLVAQPGRRSL